MTAVESRPRVSIRGPAHVLTGTLLTEQAQAFLAELHRRFEPRRRALLERRRERQESIDRAPIIDFDPETRDIRDAEWTVAPVPPRLLDRRVEITGPVDRKMIINALNSGASVFMADFEDATSPSWANLLEGQQNLSDAVRGTISLATPDKTYRLSDRPATLFVRPRGWHLTEKHVVVDGQPMSGALFDFGLFAFHNAREAAALGAGSGPYFYLPKLQSCLEARLWSDVFNHAQDALGLPRGTFRATVLIETIHATFAMDEILYELRDHSAGLNCGRWDYIFSFIKTFRQYPGMLLPDRAQVTMDKGFLKAYVELLIHTCHRRGIHAMGGMSAYIPVRNDPAANEAALDRVRADKEREVRAGHDGTWVAHPALVPVARAVFDKHMPGPNQITPTGARSRITAKDLLAVPAGTITLAGLRHNIDVGIQYLAAWLGGSGAVPIYNLMEDAATAEIARSQVWQWLRHVAVLEDGTPVTRALVERTIDEERRRLAASATSAAPDRLRLAGQLFTDLVLAGDYQEFLTLAAYHHLD